MKYLKRTYGAAAFAAVLFMTAALLIATAALLSGCGSRGGEDDFGQSRGGETSRYGDAAGSDSRVSSADDGTGMANLYGDDGPKIIFTDELQGELPGEAENELTGDVFGEDLSGASGSTPGEASQGASGDTAAPQKHVIVLDPGHGGKQVGAANNGFVEKQLTLKVALLVRDLLQEYDGAEVYLTRETDTELSKDLVEDLEMRAQFALECGAEALVSLHFNGSESHNLNGATVYISNREAVNEASEELGECILYELGVLGIKKVGVRTRNSNDMKDEKGKPLDYYAINRHCAARGIPGIIVEQCYMDNSTDRPFFDTDEALLDLAKAVAAGIAAYLGLY